MLPKNLSPIEKKALKEFKKQTVAKLKNDILALKLFGSKARGDFRKDSDIDILVLLKKSTLKKEDLIFDIAVDILLKYGIDLSVKIFSEKEYEKGLNWQIPFFLSIQREAARI